MKKFLAIVALATLLTPTAATGKPRSHPELKAEVAATEVYLTGCGWETGKVVGLFVSGLSYIGATPDARTGCLNVIVQRADLAPGTHTVEAVQSSRRKPDATTSFVLG